MVTLKFFRIRYLAVLMLVLIFAASAFAFAAANVVPESGAGDGTNTISGYTVTNIRYTLNAGNPANLASVRFDINPTAAASAPNSVSVQLDGGAWATCAVTTSPTWSCPTGVTALAANNLRVVAAQ